MVENAMPYRKLFDGRNAFGKYNDNDMMMLGARQHLRRRRETGRPRPRSVPGVFRDGEPIHQSRQVGPAGTRFLDLDEALLWRRRSRPPKPSPFLLHLGKEGFVGYAATALRRPKAFSSSFAVARPSPVG